jgi:hypothetical protein
MLGFENDKAGSIQKPEPIKMIDIINTMLQDAPMEDTGEDEENNEEETHRKEEKQISNFKKR